MRHLITFFQMKKICFNCRWKPITRDIHATTKISCVKSVRFCFPPSYSPQDQSGIVHNYVFLVISNYCMNNQAISTMNKGRDPNGEWVGNSPLKAWMLLLARKQRSISALLSCVTWHPCLFEMLLLFSKLSSLQLPLSMRHSRRWRPIGPGFVMLGDFGEWETE